MKTVLVTLVVTLALLASVVEGFVVPSSSSNGIFQRQTTTTTTTKFSSITTKISSSHHDDDVENDSAFTDSVEIDRRLAMVRAAAAVVLASSSALTMDPTVADAKSAIFSLEAKVTDIEKKNLATKNSNGDPVKHTPVVSIEDATTMAGKVVQFTVPHVMDAEKPHYIQYMWLEDVSGKQKKPPGNIVAVKAFQKTDTAPPTLIENVASGRLPTLKAGIVKGMILKPCLYCNLHGLWEGEPVPIV
ncbi:Desulfoferrodoxin [Nitzschia inconspicua]|uniref:Desulfoferrodoxin n=1 Tax=Nitzschia inconspicua TaxID=303405 RepID=A0A9K3LIR6_9STRA|nr:Desulfoferrodoxin [Nitzschia inconspicua]